MQKYTHIHMKRRHRYRHKGGTLMIIVTLVMVAKRWEQPLFIMDNKMRYNDTIDYYWATSNVGQVHVTGIFSYIRTLANTYIKQVFGL